MAKGAIARVRSVFGYEKYSIILAVATSFFGMVLSSHFQPYNGEPAFSFFTADSVMIRVFTVMDGNHRLEGYVARVSSPICDKTECYDVELDFYWNVLGDFQRYEIIPEKPLTKREHEPFTKDDYMKLTEVLKLDEPAFADMQKEDMIGNWVSDGVDGLTGATIAAIKNDIVPGAAYSCYTLWHIANGPVGDSIRKNTRAYLDSILIMDLMGSADEKAHYYLIDFLPAEKYLVYSKSILQLIWNQGGYFSRYAMRAMPTSFLSDSLVQQFFAEHLQELDYFAQVNLVERLQSHVVTDLLAMELLDQLSSRNSALTEGIIHILTSTRQEFGDDLKTSILEGLIEKSVPLGSQSIQQIESWASTKSLRRKVKKLKKFNRIP